MKWRIHTIETTDRYNACYAILQTLDTNNNKQLMMMPELRQEREQHPAHRRQRIPHLRLCLLPLRTITPAILIPNPSTIKVMVVALRIAVFLHGMHGHVPIINVSITPPLKTATRQGLTRTSPLKTTKSSPSTTPHQGPPYSPRAPKLKHTSLAPQTALPD